MADLPRVRDLVVHHGGDKTTAELNDYMEEHARLRSINADLRYWQERYNNLGSIALEKQAEINRLTEISADLLAVLKLILSASLYPEDQWDDLFKRGWAVIEKAEGKATGTETTEPQA